MSALSRTSLPEAGRDWLMRMAMVAINPMKPTQPKRGLCCEKMRAKMRAIGLFFSITIPKCMGFGTQGRICFSLNWDEQMQV
jgi:hypothetical protein